MTTLVWFRNDLRHRDHAALHAAAQGDEPLVGCFLLADRQWREHDWAPCKVAFTLAQLRDLAECLAALRIPLLIRRAQRFDRAPAAMAGICREVAATSVHAIAEYEVDEQARDRAVSEHLRRQDIPLLLHHDQCILPPGGVLTGAGEAYKVFTPFRRRWLEQLDEADLQALPPPRRQAPVPGLQADEVPDELPAYPDAAFDEGWRVGEESAHRQLQAAVEGRLQHYAERRDRPAVDGTSRLSPYLASGVLSARSCLLAAIAAGGGAIDRGPLAPWVSELAWRDFYRHIVAAFPRVCRHRPFKPEMDDIPWNHDPGRERAWQEGRTGIPIVDAAMRQLAASGWMHNRLRMITAMFFSKNCLLDWRRGETFFMRSLIDGDLASNNGGWQWSASTGCDAAPYFGIFNPVSQSRRHDPEGRFLRRYLHELADLDEGSIHDPSPEQRRACGYPEPIVDLKVSRARAIAVFKGG